jgi:four helix bundle protein
MPIKKYSDLEVWQKAIELVAESYQLAHSLPRAEAFGLVSQIRRAAVSIPANIAEGHGRIHCAEYVHHLSVARGSLVELETFITIAERLSYIAPEQLRRVRELCDHVSRMLANLIKRLRGPRAPRPALRAPSLRS